VVVVHGIIPSYYLKQMAQTVVLRLDGIHSVRNLVEVSGTNWVQQVDEEGPKGP
jgi:hypothetical protein